MLIFITENSCMTKVKLLILIFPVLITFCHSPDSVKENEDGIPGRKSISESLIISEDIMAGISNVSSIVETSALVKGLGLPYTNDYLAAMSNNDEFGTNFKRAFILGVYGADLGYLNTYTRKTYLVEYIDRISQLAEGLEVAEFFDSSTLRRLAVSGSAPDSLMYISVQSFNQMDQHLRNAKRASLSAAIIAGVWIEGLYILTQAFESQPGEKLAERIGEQKIILNDLMLIFRNYQHVHPEFEDLIRELAFIKEDYDKVSITYTVGEPEVIERDGMLMIVQHERSSVDISNEQLDNIVEKAEIIRNKLIK
jgi:hypothetical protein